MSTKLDQLYSLRKNFTIIGLTGRTGSGCSDLADLLSIGFNENRLIRKPDELSTSVFQRKYQIVYNYAEKNWKKYNIIEYKKVLFLLLLPKLYKYPNNTILHDYFRYRMANETTEEKINFVKNKIKKLILENKNLIEQIIEIGDLTKVKTKSKLEALPSSK